jgi:DNA helicase-2/ATP-dependent DNA helicase PcrA
MTAHKSKGLEFEVVFVPHLTDNNWSGSSKKQYFDIPLMAHTVGTNDLIEDERRLLYVAMTRAKKTLFISSSNVNTDGRELIPARLMEEISSDCVNEVNTILEEKQFNPISTLLQSSTPVPIDVKLLLNVLQERGFSATSLNNYLRSPWDYFYRNVLRIPETQPIHMQYGTAIHNTLEYVTSYHTKDGVLPNQTAVKKKLEQELNRLPLSTEEYVLLLEKGLEELTIYVEHLSKVLPKITKEEFSLKVFLETGIPELPELLLTGKLDRIDLDEEGGVFQIIDYKTGKPKTRNVIEGNTKDSDGGYKRQLVFYALLLSLYDDDRYRCREGVLSFVQPDAKGEIREEKFTITEEEIEELKNLIIKVAREIISGSFLSQSCDDTVSDYCHLVDLLRK